MTLEQLRVEIANLKEKYWTLINMHNPSPRIFKARKELDDQITKLEVIECDLENQQA